MSSESQGPPRPITLVAGFDDDDADLIIRSSDGAHFAVFKYILGEASPVFADMFTLPQTSPDGCRPIVDLTEDRDIIHALLQLCNPVTPPEIDTLQTLSGLMVVCDKYSMDGPKDVLEKCYPRQFLKKDPLLVYAIASHARCTTMMLEAARQCLQKPAAYMINADLAAFPPISVASYQSVLKYHLACRTAASSVVVRNKFGPLPGTFSLYCWVRCNVCRKSASVYVDSTVVAPTVWWAEMMADIARSLDNQPVNAVFNPASWALKIIPKLETRCHTCKAWCLPDLQIFLPLLQKRVKEVVAEVPLEPVF